MLLLAFIFTKLLEIRVNLQLEDPQIIIMWTERTRHSTSNNQPLDIDSCGDA